MKIRKLDVQDIEGFHIGNAEDIEGGTGVTVIISEEGAVAGVDVEGGGPATIETDLLRSENTVQTVNAVVLSGGSAFGLEAASGVRRALALRKIGFRVGDIHVPIVTGASLYDLEAGRSDVFPDVTMGIDAVNNAYEGVFRSGNRGAGTGATVGKMFGMHRAMKTGLGTFACGDDVIQVGAIAAVNACADIYNGAGNIIAGLRTEDGTAIHGTIKALKDMVHNETGRRESTLEELREKAARKAELSRRRISDAEFIQTSPVSDVSEDIAPETYPQETYVQEMDDLESAVKEDSGISVSESKTATRADIAKAIMEAYLKSGAGAAEPEDDPDFAVPVDQPEEIPVEIDDFASEEPALVVDDEPAVFEETPEFEAVDPAPEAPEHTESDTTGFDEVPSGEEPASYEEDAPVGDGPGFGEPEDDPYALSEEEKADMGYGIPFNTTIACLITNAKMTKSQANKLASILHDAYARAIKPVHSTLDGDTVFVMSTGKEEVNFDAFAALATDVMQYAIIDAAVNAKGAYGFPSASDMASVKTEQ